MEFKVSDAVNLFLQRRDGQIGKLPNGFWGDKTAARSVLEYLWLADNINPAYVPRHCRKRWYEEKGLSTLLRHYYRNSPSLLLMSLYPGRYRPADFPEFPKAQDLKAASFAAEGISPAASKHQLRRISARLRKAQTGTCLMCSSASLEGDVYCAVHRARLRDRWRHRYAQARASGTCYRCRRAPAVEQGVCPRCLRRYSYRRGSHTGTPHDAPAAARGSQDRSHAGSCA